MPEVQYFAVVVAAIAGLFQGAIWYSGVFGNVYTRLRAVDHQTVPADSRPPWGELLAEFGRCLVVAYVLAHLIEITGASSWVGALVLALWLWLGFQAMAIAGSVVHENYDWRLFAIHVSDALVKTALMAVILAIWP